MVGTDYEVGGAPEVVAHRPQASTHPEKKGWWTTSKRIAAGSVACALAAGGAYFYRDGRAKAELADQQRATAVSLYLAKLGVTSALRPEIDGSRIVVTLSRDTNNDRKPDCNFAFRAIPDKPIVRDIMPDSMSFIIPGEDAHGSKPSNDRTVTGDNFQSVGATLLANECAYSKTHDITSK